MTASWQPCLLGYSNALLTAASLYASSAEAALPVTQLLNDQGAASTAWQTAAGMTTAYLLIDSGNPAAAWRAILLARTNLTPAAQIRVRIGTMEQVLRGDAMASPVDAAAMLSPIDGAPMLAPYDAPGVTSPSTAGSGYDTLWIAAGVAPGYGQAAHIPAAPVAGQVCRIDISDPSNPDGHLNVPLCYAGDAWQPSHNYSYASARGSDVQQVQQLTRGGQRYTAVQSRGRRVEAKFASLRAWELDRIDDLRAWVQTGRNLLWVPNPLSDRLGRDVLYGDAVLPDDLAYPASTPVVRSMSLRITERL